MYIYDNISLSSSYNENCFRQNLYKKSKYSFYIQQLFFFENLTVYVVMWKNMVEPDMPQMRI
jgi:hypothetical protein